MLFSIIYLYFSILINTPSVLLPTSNFDKFKLKVYSCNEKLKNNIHYWKAIVLYNELNQDNLLLRVQDQCITSEVFGSLRCDCKQQLDISLSLIQNNGMLIYLPQEGRNLGLFNKILTYKLQENGFNTFDSCKFLNLPQESREYEVVKDILDDFEINSINLITNNTMKIEKLQKLGITINNVISINIKPNNHNQNYLDIKYNN